MADRPPRRSQRPQRKRSKSFPLIPFAIGIVVLGFVLGAGLSMLGHRDSTPVAAVRTTAPRPSLAAATLAPLATPRPLRSEAAEVSVASTATATTTERARPSGRALKPLALLPSPQPSSKPSPLPSVQPSATQSARPAARPSAASATANAAAIATAVATATRLRSPVTPVPFRPRASVAAKIASPAPAAVTTSTAVAASASAPAATIDADSDFGRLSASVVRQYLRALARGDTASAYGAFGASPGSAGISLSERPVLDSTAQIGAIQARGSNDAQTVSVTIATSSGAYYATYNVRRTATGAAVIVSHSINKG